MLTHEATFGFMDADSMVDTNNYFVEIEKIGVSALPDTLRKSHDFVVKSTNNDSSWETYHNNDTVRKVINLYLEKLNQYLGRRPANKTQSQKSDSVPDPVRKTAKAPKPVSKPGNAKTSNKPKNPAGKHGKKVEHLREEVKIIKRFVSLHNKVKSPNSVLALLKGLQKAIIQKLIRKTSPLAKEIQTIQDKLVNLYSSMRGDLRIEINGKELSRFVMIAGGESVYPSINIMKRYIGMQGKEVEPKKIDTFVKQIESSLSKKKVSEDDPYLDKVRTILNTLKKAKAGTTLSTAKAELNGLEGIVKECGCKTGKSLGKIYDTGGRTLRRCKKGTYSDAKKGACSHNRGLSGVLTAEEIANRKFEYLEFTSPWSNLVGKPATNFTMMLHGEPGAGKTTLLLKFAKYLANTFGKVLYVSSEEFAASTMTEKVNTLLNPFPANLEFAENLKDPRLSNYAFIILDSVNDLGLQLQDYKGLRAKYPNAAFILILQHTKAGKYRGGKDWEHEIEIGGEVVNGVITIYRNRYGVRGSMNFFTDTPVTNYTISKP
ncbi:MAG TPA: ATP-binding protein [Cyclobacteriaceae bacterium]|nr:ATP-binding protein [Cyclobacteriaceae bacterium]HMV08177.1 ATP-binding protein [Cyclobacteriaceae bacterium]HMX00818.1 ATP-binding protein [Cyclobacteriaceae bacterium]HMX49307.1 ATP-binding protein [Cyclobacteriaceae bacterium]HMY93621.1 ATP-binding protein [Cyclobacteriaceae bacterium]